MTKIGSFSFLALLMTVGSAAAGLDVTATVDRNSIGAGDTLVYTVSVTTDGRGADMDSEPKLPDLQGLELETSSQRNESQSTFVNGKFTVKTTHAFDYQITAPRKGVFKIGAAKVIVDGKEYLTKPIAVTVNDSGSGSPVPPQARGRVDTPDDVDPMEEMFNRLLQRQMGRGQPGPRGGQINPNDAFFIQVDVDKDHVYAGEQVTASWYLYTRGQIADIDTLKYPDLKGFWKEEIEMATRLNFQQAVVNGIAYQKALLVSYALFPIKAGKATIDPYKAKCTVVVGGPFGFGRSYPFSKASKAMAIEVAEVPTQDRPPEFTGAIGRFQVSALLDQSTIPANQPVTLKIKFSGRGNAKVIDLPSLGLPPSLELYSQKSDAKFFKDGTSYKEFEVLLIPREAGQFQIPPVKAAYFDPDKKKFESIVSNALSLTVTPGKPGEMPPPAPLAKGGADSAPSDVLVLPPPLTMEASGSGWVSALASPFWAVVYAILFTVLGIKTYLVLLRKPKRESLYAAVKSRMRLVQAAIDSGDWRKAGVEMTNSIYLILGAITERGGANLEFAKLMDSASPSIRRELSEPLRALLDRSETLGFAPEAAVADLKGKKELNKLRGEMEKVLNKAIGLSLRDESKERE